MPDQGVNFFRCQFAGVLGHAAFAVGDDIAQIVGGGRGRFFGNERWSGKVAAPGGFAVTLGAVFLENGVRGQGRVRRRGLGKDSGENEEQY